MQKTPARLRVVLAAQRAFGALRWRDGNVALFLVLASSASGCCREPEDTCLPWVAEDHEFTLSLLGQYASKIPFGTLPHPAWTDLDSTCGDGLELAQGKSLDADVARTFSAGGACGACKGAEIDVHVPDVTWLEKDEELDPSIDQFGESGRATIRDGCSGRYVLAVYRVNEHFIDSASAPVLSDYMFYRELEPDDPPACGLAIERGDSCFDNWFVRIVDHRGAQLSKDNPR